MTKLSEVCRHIRSKNAGPFWVTFDLFFDGPENFARFHNHPALGPETMQYLFDADPALVQRYFVPQLNVVKISCARSSAQGGVVERDMHCGQQFARLLDLDLS